MKLILIGGALAYIGFGIFIWSLLAAASRADEYNQELERIFNEEWEYRYGGTE